MLNDFYNAQLKSRGFEIEPEDIAKIAEATDTVKIAHLVYNQMVIDGVPGDAKERAKIAMEIATAFEAKAAEVEAGVLAAYEAGIKAAAAKFGVSEAEALKIAEGYGTYKPEGEAAGVSSKGTLQKPEAKEKLTDAPKATGARRAGGVTGAKAMRWMGKNPLATAGIAAGAGLLAGRASKD